MNDNLLNPYLCVLLCFKKLECLKKNQIKKNKISGKRINIFCKPTSYE